MTFDATKQLQRPGVPLAQAGALPCSLLLLFLLRLIGLICIFGFCMLQSLQANWGDWEYHQSS